MKAFILIVFLSVFTFAQSAPTDGQTLVWNTSRQLWLPTTTTASPIFTGTITFPNGAGVNSSGYITSPYFYGATWYALGNINVLDAAAWYAPEWGRGTNGTSTSVSVRGKSNSLISVNAVGLVGGAGGSFDLGGSAWLVGGEGGLQYTDGTARVLMSSALLMAASNLQIGWSTSTSTQTGQTPDTIMRRAAAANLAFGAADAAAPVAQTLSVQNVVAGTSNTAGAAWTFAGSRGTGTGLGGRIAWQTAPAGSTGSTQNALVEACAIESSGTFKLKALAFSALPTAVANGEMFFCSDGAVTSVADNTLTSGGSGALAIRINGAWRAFNLQN